MKRLICLILALCLYPLCAMAQETVEDAVTAAKSMLTEVYGYSTEEAAGFAFRVREQKDSWYVEFHPDGHPEWTYTGRYRKGDMRSLESRTPFVFDNTPNFIPGEAAVRDTLREAEESGWFKEWSASGRDAFINACQSKGIRVNGSLLASQTNLNYTAARAIDDLFLSSYGLRAEWSTNLTQWRNEVLKQYGFTTADCVLLPSLEKGVRRYIVTTPYLGARQIAEFVGDAPEDIKAALEQSKFAGYDILCGASVTMNANKVSFALVALEKDEVRVLTVLATNRNETQWHVHPISDKALLTGRDAVITYDARESDFVIHYPLSATASERFVVETSNVFMEKDVVNYMLYLMRYESHDDLTDSGVLVKDGVFTTYQGDQTRETLFEQLSLGHYLDYINADTFPRTAQAYREAAAKAYRLPDDFAVSKGAHLREQTSSHSKDLGTINNGVLMRILDTVPGDPAPWAHVQIGLLEGYMSDNYVKDPGELVNDQPLPPLRVAEVKEGCALKESASPLAKTIMELKAGYRMYVLATLGDDLYVCIPSGEINWYMDINGAYGFVKASDVKIAASPYQLSMKD